MDSLLLARLLGAHGGMSIFKTNFVQITLRFRDEDAAEHMRLGMKRNAVSQWISWARKRGMVPWERWGRGMG